VLVCVHMIVNVYASVHVDICVRMFVSMCVCQCACACAWHVLLCLVVQYRTVCAVRGESSEGAVLHSSLCVIVSCSVSLRPSV